MKVSASMPSAAMQSSARNGAQTAEVSVHRVLLDDKAGLKKIGELHMELLSAWGPMTALGERFVREACYAVNMRDGLLEVDLLNIDGQAAGFVAYTARSITFHRASLRRYWPRVLFELALSLASRPLRLIRLIRALGVVASRRSEETALEPLGEIVCIGVRPQYLNAKFVKSTGIRVSELLIEHAAAYMRRAGVKEMRMLVDKPNKAALFLYHNLGAHFSEFKQAGAPMVEVVFDLSQVALGAKPGLPAIWEAPEVEAPSNVASGWRSYWERVADNERIFRYEADDYFQRLLRNVDIHQPLRVLDFGCGYGFVAAMFARRGHRVSVWDASSNARMQSRFRLAPYPEVQYLDLSSDDPRDVSATANYAGMFDLITVHSVIQYMSVAEIETWLAGWRTMLAPGGRLLVSDIIPPDNRTLPELFSLLALSARKHFFISALWECIRETPRYWAMRNTLSLTTLNKENLNRLADRAGLGFSVLPENLSHRAGRLSVFFQKMKNSV